MQTMGTGSSTITADQLLATRDDDCRRELVRGQVRVMSPSGWRHSAIGLRLASLLEAHVRSHGLGLASGADGGYLLFRDPDTVYAPDAGFVRRERLPQDSMALTGYFPGPPDLAAEALSPSDGWADVMQKIEDYLAAGTRMVFVVDPQRRRDTVFQPGAALVLLQEGDTLDGGDAVPGWRMPLAELFALPRPREP